MALHFTAQEFKSRENKVIKSMQEKNLDALLLFRQESMYWLTGYDTFGYVFFQCLVFTSFGNKILLTRAPDLRQAQNTSNIKDIRIWIDHEDNNPVDKLKFILRDLNLENKNLGIEYEAYGLTGGNALRLNKSLENFAILHDESLLISRHRLTKSDQEIFYVRKAAKLADQALEKAWELSHPGADESEILAAMQGTIFKGGGDYPGNEFIIGSGPDALLCRYFSGRRKLSPIDQLTLEFAGVYRHYHAALMRTIPIGEAKNEHKELHAICLEALYACESKLKILRLGKEKKLVFISSKVGSIEDNTDGGMYIYRTSKTALNQIIKSLSIDFKDENFITVALHPGWVQTNMGGPNALIDTKTSVKGMTEVINNLTSKNSGKFYNYDGSPIPW